MLITPATRYQQDTAKPGFQYDPAQANAIKHLQALYEQLVQPTTGGWLVKCRQWLANMVTGGNQQQLLCKGLYLWGGVGRGKTYLMDSFYDCLPFANKRRLHFHAFMQQVHADLQRLAGTQNPLAHVAKQLAQHRVLCLDEFCVIDIADAMLLGRLLSAVFQHNLYLITTSNSAPNDLYRDGLQRDQFLPAIALLQQHLTVVNVDNGTDYRLRLLAKTPTYFYPLNNTTQHKLTTLFHRLLADPNQLRPAETITVAGRPINTVWRCADVGWFNFTALCDGPRSQTDYIELAHLFHTLILAEVPPLNETNADQARRFIHLVDVLYDSRIKLILSAATPLDDLYTGHTLAQAFQRTRSRLQAMQATAYLGAPCRWTTTTAHC